MSKKYTVDEIAASTFKFLQKDDKPVLTADDMVNSFEMKLGPPPETFWKWVMGVSQEEMMRNAVDEALGREGPLIITKRLKKEGIVQEYLGARCNSIERFGDSVSVGCSYQTVRTWLVSKRSKGWICLDDEYVFEL